MATETRLQLSQVLVKSPWSAITALVLAACSSNGQQEHAPSDNDQVVQVRSALSTGDICGEQCGGDTLAPGEACCRNGAETAYSVDQECCTSTGVQPKYPIADLNACPTRVPHAGYVLTTNGCSVHAPLAAAVANGGLLTGTALAFYSNVFYAACNSHDSCYGTCNTASGTDGSVKATCDSSFRANTRQTCLLRFAGRPFARAACLRAASAFYRGVRLGGGPFYAAAQGEACDCCVGDASCDPQEANLSMRGDPVPFAPADVHAEAPFLFLVENDGPDEAQNVVVSISFFGDVSDMEAEFELNDSGSWAGESDGYCSLVSNELVCGLGTVTVGTFANITGTVVGLSAGTASASAIVTSSTFDPDSGDTAVAGWEFQACPDGQYRCDDDCVDLGTDRENCGGCGTACTEGQSCFNGDCCTPTTCAAAEAECGTVDDGCGGSLGCDECTSPLTCTENQCLCEPMTCPDEGAECGSIDDDCGGTVDCGDCTSPETCGGGGVPNQCGCTPMSPAQACLGGQNCGTAADGCGDDIDCGTCTAPEICGPYSAYSPCLGLGFEGQSVADVAAKAVAYNNAVGGGGCSAVSCLDGSGVINGASLLSVDEVARTYTVRSVCSGLLYTHAVDVPTCNQP